MSWASIGIIWTFLFVMGWSWQGCVWLYCSEIPPLDYRHLGGAITAGGEWLATWLFVMVLPVGLENIKWRFWIFVLTGNVVAVVFVYFLCPETGGKTLEQIDYIFAEPGTFTPGGKGFTGGEDFDTEQQKTWTVEEKSAEVQQAEKVEHGRP